MCIWIHTGAFSVQLLTVYTFAPLNKLICEYISLKHFLYIHVHMSISKYICT